MRIGLLTDGGYPYATGESRLWCDRLVRGLASHTFDIYALSRSARQEERGWIQLPRQVGQVRTASLWVPDRDGRAYGRRERRRFAARLGELVSAVCTTVHADGEHVDGGHIDGGHLGGRYADHTAAFAEGLYGLADLAREHGGLCAALRSETAVRILESACRAPGTHSGAHAAAVPDYLAFADHLERALRPLSLDWYGPRTLAAADLCHATSGGPAALPGLLAKRFFGVPLLVTEYGVQLRAHYLATAGAPGDGFTGAGAPPLTPPVRTLLAGLQRRLAAEVYRQAAVITPGNSHARRWQERCGADPARLRTVYPGMETARFAGVDEDAGAADTLVWVGRIEPTKDLVSLLHAFAAIRRARPEARLRIIGTPAQGAEAVTYLAHCRALAAQLFPDEAADAHAVGENPVSFEDIGDPEAPELPDAYGAGSVVVLSSTVEGFPVSLVEAMFCGRATVSTDVGAVVEIVGGTGLVVPPRNPRALADACVALLSDPGRRERLGAAARARALELFSVEQNVAAFRSIYLELVSHAPVHRPADGLGADGAPLPFAHPAEASVRGRWTGVHRPAPQRHTPSWAKNTALPAGTRGGPGESDV
ncbi:glycosyltransferase [Streptomyces sp. NPDC088725]|uniref:glycosyltransferase n=1 Tax=Streptomyces sp. NPDC088725 TaxID=3365873 RepID=UPI00381749AB